MSFPGKSEKRKLQYFGHVVRAENLHVLHSRIAGNKSRGRPRKR